MKEKILAIIRRNCEQHLFERNTAGEISEEVHVSRNEVAAALQNLTKQKKLIKIESRPLYFLDRVYME